MAGNTVNRIWVLASGSGERGVTHMLYLMARTAKDGARDPDVRTVAENIINGDETYIGRARAIHDWIESNIKYVPDPVYTDAVMPPRQVLIYKTGDCDDLATLGAALLGSLGIQSRFQAVGFENNEVPYSHVFAQALIGANWITTDTTPELNDDGSVSRHYAFSEEPPGIQFRKVRNV